jgi:mRNA interferase HigB
LTKSRREDILSSLRIIKQPFLTAAARKHPQAASWLEAWRMVVRAAKWRNLNEVRKTYPHADSVKVRSGRVVVVFNVAGNHFRLITALHYHTGILFTLCFLTHAEYNKNEWKNNL